jgi:broad specificity phosphatase PhoE
MSRRVSAFPAALLVLAAACVGTDETRRPAELTAPSASAARHTAAAVDTTSPLSSVCQTLQAKLQENQTALAANPSDSTAKDGVEVYQGRFEDACK